MAAEASSSNPRRVVVTGLGLCVPAGPGRDQAWQAAAEDRSPRDLSGPGGYPRAPITGFDPKTVVDRKKALKLMGPNMQFALGASREAWADSGREVGDSDSQDTGTVFGVRVRPGDFPELTRVAAQSMVDGAFSYERLGDEGISAIFPLSMLRNLPNLVTAQVTIQLGLKGFTDSITSGEISGLQAVGEGRDVVRRGDADIVLAGSADDLIDPFSMGWALASGWVGEDDGVLMGQGAAAVILEERERATSAGRAVLAEVLAYEEGFGAPEDPSAASQVIRRALHTAGLGPEQVSTVWVDACGMPGRDDSWGEGIGQVFKECATRPRLCGQAARIGHLGAASGEVEVVFAIEALRRGTLPRGTLTLEGSGLEPAAEGDPAGSVALVLSASRVGGRAALVLGGALDG